MNNEHLTEMKTVWRQSRLEAIFCLLDHPDEVLHHPRLTRGEKRALLSSWASDAHAVENQPTLRRLDNGTVLPVDEILRALKSLDEKPKGVSATYHRILPLRSLARGRRVLDAWRRGGRSPGPDDDDDPPPCPASIAPRPRTPGGTGIALGAELACA